MWLHALHRTLNSRAAGRQKACEAEATIDALAQRADELEHKVSRGVPRVLEYCEYHRVPYVL